MRDLVNGLVQEVTQLSRKVDEMNEAQKHHKLEMDASGHRLRAETVNIADSYKAQVNSLRM